jgi:hypothetical protein
LPAIKAELSPLFHKNHNLKPPGLSAPGMELLRMEALRVRCRNQRCRSKLPIPTDNEHKAFCTPYCYNQFYHWRSSRQKMPKHCHARDCRLAFKRFPESYLFPKEASLPAECDLGPRSAHFTGLKSAHNDPAYRIIAGPPLSDFAFWAATLDPPKPQRLAGQSWGQPGEIAAEWTAREMACREADDAQYVADDEERLRTEPVAP